MKRALLLALALGGCSAGPQTLPSARNSDGRIVLPPLCRDVAELKAYPVTVHRVPRSDPILHPGSIDADGRWFPGVIYVRADLVGWAAEDTELHERAHQCMFVKTGNPQFHR